MLNRKIRVPKYLHELHGENPLLFTLIATYLLGILAGFIVVVSLGRGMPGWKSILLFILYTDMSGGVVSNFSSSTSQYYEKNLKLRIPFIIMHLIHPALFILIFPGFPYYFIYNGLYTIIACLILSKINITEYQQIIASILIVAGIIISFRFNLPEKILYSFAPLFMIKLIIGFSVRRPVV